MADSGSTAGDSERRDFARQLRDAARVIRAQWWLIALCVAAAVAGTAIYQSTREDYYSSTARLLLLQRDPNVAVLQGPIFIDTARERATDIELAEQRRIAEGVVDRLDLDSSAGEVLGKISTGISGDSNVFSVTATDTTPATTAALANGFAQEFVEFQRDTAERRYRDALRLVRERIQRTSAAGGGRELERLRRQADDLRLLASLQTGDAQVVERAIGPGVAVEENSIRDLLLAAILGLLVGLGLAFLRDRLDPRLKTEEQVRQALPGVPVIGSIARIKRTAASRTAALESFHLLQADLELLSRHDSDLSFILVTSALPAEGKSTTAANIALAMAQRGTAVTLIEADLRNPELSRRWQVNGPGLADVLRGDASFDDVAHMMAVTADDKGRGPRLAISGEVEFVPAGSANGDYRKLLSGESFAHVLPQLSQNRAAAIIDGPPLGLFGDVAPLARLVDGVILVVRLGHSRGPSLRRLGDRLARASVKPIGIVVVGSSPHAREYRSYSS